MFRTDEADCEKRIRGLAPMIKTDCNNLDVATSESTVAQHGAAVPRTSPPPIEPPRTKLNTLSPMERFAILSPENDLCPWETRRILSELVPGNVTPKALEAILCDAAIQAVHTPERSTKTRSALAVTGVPSRLVQLDSGEQGPGSCDP